MNDQHQEYLDNYLGGAEDVTFLKTLPDGGHMYKKPNGYFIFYDQHLGFNEDELPTKTKKRKAKPEPEPEPESEPEIEIEPEPVTKRKPVTRDDIEEILDRAFIRFIKQMKVLVETQSDQVKPALLNAFDEMIANWAMSKPKERQLASSVLGKLKASPATEEDFEDRADSPIVDKKAKDTKAMLDEFRQQYGVGSDSDSDTGEPEPEDEEDEPRSRRRRRKDSDSDTEIFSERINPEDVY